MKEYSGKLLFPILIILMIYSSGMVLFQAYYKISLLGLFGFVIGLIIFKRPMNMLSIEQMLFGISLCTLFLFTLFINLDYFYIETYIGILIKVFLAFVVSWYINFEKFKVFYPKVILVLVVISFPFYILGITYPAFINSLPILYKAEDILFGNAFLHLYPLPVWKETLSRNNGVFWEPGAYQAFISLALLMELLNHKRSYTRVLVFVVGIVTTGSTTGYFILLLLALMAVLNSKSKKLKITILLSIVLFILSPTFSTYVGGKFDEQGDRYASFTRRDYDWRTDLVIYSNNIIAGSGYERYYEQFPEIIGRNIPITKFVTSSSNSLTLSLAVYGIVSFFIIVVMNVKYCFLMADQLSGNKIINFLSVFFILFLIYSSEPFFITPIWLLLGFYGVSTARKLNLRRVQWDSNLQT